MRNVKRRKKPMSLQRNGSRWKRELLAELSAACCEKRKPKQSFYDRYQQDDIRKAIHKMYNGLCCYCETRVKPSGYEHIEHRKPKKKFPESTFDWENLHLACPRCNVKKSDKWDASHEILDAVIDVPITQHLTYEESADGIYRKELTLRGNTTIKHTDLNCDDLLQARAKIYLEVMKTIRTIRKAAGSSTGLLPEHKNPIRMLRKKSEDQYGSMIKFLLEEFLADVLD